MSTKSRVLRTVMLLLKIAVTASAIWLVFRHYDIAQLANRVAKADRLWLGLGLGTAFFQLYILAWRWQLLHRLLTASELPMRLAFAGTSRSVLYGQLLPAIVGTDAIRVAAVSRQTGLMPAVRSVVGDRIVGLWTLLLLVVVSLTISAFLIGHGAVVSILVIVSLCGAAVASALLLDPGMLARIPLFGEFLAQIAGDSRRIFRFQSGWAVGGIALASHVLSALIFAAIARGVGGAISLPMCLLVIPQVQLIATVPLSLGGWGLREAAVVSAYSLIGADPAAGAIASVLFGLSNPAVGALGELCSFLIGRPLANPAPSQPAQ